MGYSPTEDMKNFLEVSSEMKMSNLLQLSMDGPSVNWSFLEKLTSNHYDEFNITLLLLCSCGLHVINGALKTIHATVKWKVQLILHLFYKLFEDSRASQAILSNYIDWPGSELFPKKFCSIRWVSC